MNDGRYIDPALGTLSGEGSQQRISENRLSELAERAWDRVPSESDLQTYYDRPVLKRPVWKWYIPAYFVSGGIAGAAASLGAVAQTIGGEEMRPLVDRCRQIAAAGTAIGTVFLIADLGVKSKFLNMLRVFRPTSPMSVGSWILAPTAGAATASVLLPGALGDLAGLAAGTLGPALASYTAALTSNTAVPLWHATRRTLPPFYVASAATQAGAILNLSDFDGGAARAAHLFQVAGLLGEMASGEAVSRDASRVERVGEPLHNSRLWKTAKVTVFVSFVLSFFRGRRTRKLSAVFGLLGSIAAKYAIFRAGVSSADDPRATFAQQRASDS